MILKQYTTKAVTALSVIFLAASGVNALAQDLPGEGKQAKPARPNWDSFWFGQEILDQGMERLGYEVDTPKTLGVPAIFTSMARGDLHYMADTILPNHASIYAETEGEVRRIGPLMDPGTIQGYAVDRKTAEEHNIRYLEDLKDPEIAALFDQNGDGRADMIGPNADWEGSSAVVDHHINELGLEDSIRVVQGEYTALSADARGRYADGEPIFIYTWYPNPTTMELLPGEDLVWLELREVTLPDNQMEEYKPLPDVAGCASDPCEIGWLPTTYYIGVSEVWAQDNPAAVSFFEQVEMQLEDRLWQNQLMKEGEDRDSDIERHASDWIERHQEQFDSWIQSAIEAGKE
ncbi:glycine betaine/L-proline ABC transporter substrate-binding protein ProX [Fodinicurvata sediminis]|uniref:glycine betaine/L-proline ABC transporter substrate-binding protein ProX n=1 Tax=Fodinicurvata sediminis TaxID=1121832 RepID=UPI0003B78C96|nr:glycine betaine/L-proline ABC transporter substrate-binding protein ProX [Fodinicurvata sediminis]